MAEFTHLHLHTQYSLLDGAIRLDDLFPRLLALGMKQVEADPWIKDIPEKYKLGDEVKCKILRLTDFGIFAEIEGEVEGLIYSSEVVQGEEPLKEGEEVLVRIIKIDTEDRKIGLSMKHVKGDRE